ncbi:glycosyl transferase [Planctomycetota bacterium]|nr:glycosyl transferase [Planctomycetota bacterium]
MKIAIVAPSPMPFVFGGAERFYLGLLGGLEALGHQVELVKIPIRELGVWELIEAYKTFARLDLNHFDLVITSKYPAWMVKHHRHVCYMLHKLRGLYDTYHYFGQDTAVPAGHPGIDSLLALMASNFGRREALDEVFNRLEALRHGGLPAHHAAFPAPFIRAVIHWLDGVGLATSAVASYAAISRTVAQRPGYFPTGADVGIILPPSGQARLACRPGRHIATASRLEAPKRLDLLIDAYRQVPGDTPLIIAGAGPEGDRLRALAARDPRVVMAGRIPDQALNDLYAEAIGVPFLPMDEDFGLVAFEAMAHAKPVITTTDAGGPTELVEDGRSGLIVAPEAVALAAGLARLISDQPLAAALGQAAAQRVAAMNWPAACRQLLANHGDGPAAKPIGPPSLLGQARPRMAVAVPFPVYPPRGGGQSRVFHLYKTIAERFDVELITVTSDTEAPFAGPIAPGLSETRIPRTKEHVQAEAEISSTVNWVPITDLVMADLQHLTPALGAAVDAAARRSDLLVACHPFLHPLLAGRGKPVVLEAQDVEVDLKRQILPESAPASALLERLRSLEQRAIDEAIGVVVCAEEDGVRLRKLYGNGPGIWMLAANGVDVQTSKWRGPLARRRLRRALGIDDAPVAIFIGSWHGPNLDAIESIFRFAPEVPEVTFLIIGSACNYFTGRGLPGNVATLGLVDDAVKAQCLGCADLALNPMPYGTGSNLKMLDYFAAGIPVISNRVGLRGLAAIPELHCVMAEVPDFPMAIRTLIADPVRCRMYSRMGRRLAEEQYDWRLIGRRLTDDLQSLLAER